MQSAAIILHLCSYLFQGQTYQVIPFTDARKVANEIKMIDDLNKKNPTEMKDSELNLIVEVKNCEEK